MNKYNIILAIILHKRVLMLRRLGCCQWATDKTNVQIKLQNTKSSYRRQIARQHSRSTV